MFFPIKQTFLVSLENGKIVFLKERKEHLIDIKKKLLIFIFIYGYICICKPN